MAGLSKFDASSGGMQSLCVLTRRTEQIHRAALKAAGVLKEGGIRRESAVQIRQLAHVLNDCTLFINAARNDSQGNRELLPLHDVRVPGGNEQEIARAQYEVLGGSAQIRCSQVEFIEFPVRLQRPRIVARSPDTRLLGRGSEMQQDGWLAVRVDAKRRHPVFSREQVDVESSGWQADCANDWVHELLGDIGRQGFIPCGDSIESQAILVCSYDPRYPLIKAFGLQHRRPVKFHGEVGAVAVVDEDSKGRGLPCRPKPAKYPV